MMKEMHIRTMTILIAVFAAFPNLAYSFQPTVTKVNVGIYINRIYNINVKEQTFDCEFYLWMNWKGPNSAEQYEFVNGKHTETIFRTVTTDSSGVTYLSAKVRGTFIVPFYVSEYPRDQHELFIGIEDFNWSEKNLIYQVDTASVGMSSDVYSGDWSVEFLGPRLTSNYFTPDKESFSHFEIRMRIIRFLSPFMVKIFVPLLIVVLMSMLTFFIAPEELEAQVGLGATALLSIIAFNFVISGDLPDVGYLTRADTLIMGSYVIIFLALVESVLVNVLHRRGHPSLAKKYDHTCRLVFPLVYISFLAFIFLF
jgi:hypothetical protein